MRSVCVSADGNLTASLLPLRSRVSGNILCRQVLQDQAPAPVPQKHGHGGPSIMERFKRMAPPSFKGESQPLLERADVWWSSLLRIQFEDGVV
ncbi:hypothetical protein Taro_012267 [Colocasia esculenta]|uniref:Uncharacterized protein n=1 Tax=Colocasia esculenta TaxID=4460 RepID=A0A843UCF7_COLES|nr:hypothetical protein [Colocasia esculenta]